MLEAILRIAVKRRPMVSYHILGKKAEFPCVCEKFFGATSLATEQAQIG